MRNDINDLGILVDLNFDPVASRLRNQSQQLITDNTRRARDVGLKIAFVKIIFIEAIGLEVRHRLISKPIKIGGDKGWDLNAGNVGQH